MFISLTVFFDDPFWVGVFELKTGSEIRACRVVFGSEPGDNEILEFILNNYCSLSFGPALVPDLEKPKPKGIKKLKRLAAEETKQKGISTRAQEAIRLQMEERKKQKSADSSSRLRAEKQAKYLISRQKKKEKKRGH